MDPVTGGIVGSAVGAGIGAIGSAISGGQSARASERNYKHRYQWQVKDLKKAGLNPMLSVMNPAPVPSMPNIPDIGASAVRGASAGMNAAQLSLLKTQKANVEADTLLKGSATALNVTSARESAIRAGINEANLPWAAGLAQSTALGADKAVALQQSQINRIGEEIRGLKLDNDQKERLQPLLLEAQRLINDGMSADLVRKEVYGRIWSIVPEQETVDSILEVLTNPGDWPRRLHEWGKEYTEKRRPNYVQR